MTKNKYAIVAAAALCAVIVAPAWANMTLTLRSGDGVTAPGSDPNVTMLVGPADVGFGYTLTAADFAAASSGPAAFVVTKHPNWKAHLAVDPAANWIGTNANAASAGSTALYAVKFNITDATIASAKMDFHFLVDNDLGDALNEGLFINGQAVAGTKLLGVSTAHFQFDHAFLNLDISSLVHSGWNTLYINAPDWGGPSGMQFSAKITTVAIPAPGAALLALIGLPIIGWIKRRFA